MYVLTEELWYTQKELVLSWMNILRHLKLSCDARLIAA